MKSVTKKYWPSCIVCILALMVAPFLTGCQVSIGGQTLPSPYYLDDDIQYQPKGPEFKLSREAAALQAARANEGL